MHTTVDVIMTLKQYMSNFIIIICLHPYIKQYDQLVSKLFSKEDITVVPNLSKIVILSYEYHHINHL